MFMSLGKYISKFNSLHFYDCHNLTMSGRVPLGPCLPLLSPFLFQDTLLFVSENLVVFEETLFSHTSGKEGVCRWLMAFCPVVRKAVFLAERNNTLNSSARQLTVSGVLEKPSLYMINLLQLPVFEASGSLHSTAHPSQFQDQLTYRGVFIACTGVADKLLPW